MEFNSIGKPVRIRIRVGGMEHSSLDTLKKDVEHFDVFDVFHLIKNKSLFRWLTQIGEEEVLQNLSAINIQNYDNPSTEETEKLCKCFGINDWKAQIEQLVAKHEKNGEKDALIRALKMGAQYPNYAYKLGKLYYNEHSYADAIPHFKTAADNQYEDSKFLAAFCYYKTERYRDAISYYDQIVSRTGGTDSFSGEALYCYAKAIEQVSSVDPRVKEYLKKSAERGYKLAGADTEPADADTEPNVNTSGQSPRELYESGCQWYRSQNYKMALFFLKKAIPYSDSLKFAGNCSFKLGQYKEALVYYNRYIRDHGENFTHGELRQYKYCLTHSWGEN